MRKRPALPEPTLILHRSVLAKSGSFALMRASQACRRVARKGLELDPRTGDLLNLAGICAATLGKEHLSKNVLASGNGGQPNGKLIESA